MGDRVGVVPEAGEAFRELLICRRANVSGVPTPPGANVFLVIMLSPLVDRINVPSLTRSDPSRDPARRCFSAFSFVPASAFAGEPGGAPTGRLPVIVGDVALRGWLPKLPPLPPARSPSLLFSFESGDSESSSDKETHVSPLVDCFELGSILDEVSETLTPIFAFAAAAARDNDVAVPLLG